MTQVEGCEIQERERYEERTGMRFSLHTGLQMNQHDSSLQYFSTICNLHVSACTAADDSIHSYEINTGAVMYRCNNLGDCVHCDLDSRTLW